MELLILVFIFLFRKSYLPEPLYALKDTAASMVLEMMALLEGRGLRGRWLAVVALLLPVTVAWGLEWFAQYNGFLVSLLFELLVVVVILLPAKTEVAFEEYWVAISSQQSSAMKQSAEWFDVTAENPAAAHPGIIDKILWQQYQELYGPIFWYLCLGLPGLVFYVTVAWLARTEFREDCHHLAGQLLTLMDWLGTRVSALLIALAGHAAVALPVALEAFTKAAMDAPEVIWQVSRTALGVTDFQLADDSPEQLAIADSQLEMMANLHLRTLLAWIALAAILVILGMV